MNYVFFVTETETKRTMAPPGAPALPVCCSSQQPNDATATRDGHESGRSALAAATTGQSAAQLLPALHLRASRRPRPRPLGARPEQHHLTGMSPKHHLTGKSHGQSRTPHTHRYIGRTPQVGHRAHSEQHFSGMCSLTRCAC